MEWITQAALGAFIAEMMLGKKLGNKAMLWGIGIALLPHLDYLLGALLPTWLDLWVIAGFGQSIPVAGLLAFYGGRKLSVLWKKQKVTQQEATLFILAVYGVVLCHQALTVDGAWPLWPIPFGKICYPLMPEIDLLFTLPLIFCLAKLAFFQTKKELPQRQRWLTRAVGISAVILVLGFTLKGWVHQGFRNDLAKRGITPSRLQETPASWNRLLWRCIIHSGDDLWVGYRSVFQLPDSPVRWTVYAKRPEALSAVENTKEVKAVLQKTRGWWIARPNKKGATIADLSHPEARVWGAKKTMIDSRPATTWMLDTTRPRDHLREIPNQGDPVDTFQRMVRRIFGNHGAWEANPRLSGISGILPEALMVYE
ncbi:MAG: hypothetical protein QM680_04875 [Luteolibacter sp.]